MKTENKHVSRKIFLSYSHANMNIADMIDNDLKAFGINIYRDIRDVQYRESFKKFMFKISKSDFTLILVSDEYLKSEWCMYEVLEVLNTHEFEEKILPVLTINAYGFLNNDYRLNYYKFWKEKLSNAQDNFEKFPNEHHLEIKKRISNINENLGLFFQKLTDLNMIEFELLKKKKYEPLLKIINHKEFDPRPGSLNIYFSGQWFFLDSRLKLFINDELHSIQWIKKGFNVTIPIKSNKISIKIISPLLDASVFGEDKYTHIYNLQNLDIFKNYCLTILYNNSTNDFDKDFRLTEVIK